MELLGPAIYLSYQSGDHRPIVVLWVPHLERVFLGIVKGMEMSPLSHLACCWTKGTLDEHLTDLEM